MKRNSFDIPVTGLESATAENDFIVAGADPYAWEKKTVAQTKTILGITAPEVLIMLLDKDVAIAVGDVIGNVQVPVSAAMVGKNLSNASRMYIAPVGTASTSGVVTFNIVRHREAATVDMTSSVASIAQDAKTSGAPTIDAANDDLASGDFLSVSCEAAGTGAKGPLWVKIVAE